MEIPPRRQGPTCVGPFARAKSTIEDRASSTLPAENFSAPPAPAQKISARISPLKFPATPKISRQEKIRTLSVRFRACRFPSEKRFASQISGARERTRADVFFVHPKSDGKFAEFPTFTFDGHFRDSHRLWPRFRTSTSCGGRQRVGKF
jgi:hypothetical protein